MQIVGLHVTRAMLANRRGATSIEYGLIAVLVAVAAIAGMNALGGSVLDLWTGANAKVAAVAAE